MARHLMVKNVFRRTGDNQTEEGPAASGVRLIPTSYKAKLGGQFSYPVGAAELSRALESVPQYAQLELSFHSSSLDSKKEFERILRENGSQQILKADFCRWATDVSTPQSFMEAGWYDEKWTIYIYPVLQAFRHTAHELLLTAGSKSIAEWLSAKRPEPWRHGRHDREVWFDPKAGTIAIRDVN
jgi:hypothetical protein